MTGHPTKAATDTRAERKPTVLRVQEPVARACNISLLMMKPSLVFSFVWNLEEVIVI
jgi:hypothetical protein